jgi:hypothetical protein
MDRESLIEGCKAFAVLLCCLTFTAAMVWLVIACAQQLLG